MMKAIVTYYDCARKCILESSGDYKVGMTIILTQTKNSFTKLSQMKFIVLFNYNLLIIHFTKDPKQSKQQFKEYFNQFLEEINTAFRALTEK